MATFSPRPAEFELPYFATREAYDQSLESAITANETAAGVADAKAVAAQGTADQAVLDADAAQSTADTAVTNAATAQDRADSAFSNAATAQGDATQALTNAATAQATADAAVPNRSPLPTGTDLDTVVGIGIYPVNYSTTLALNFPLASSFGVLEVLPRATTSVVQRYYSVSGPSDSRAIFVRRLNNGSWDNWRTIPYQRIDNTAGRAIYTWDDTTNREQLIYGDTGWRDISSLLNESWEVNPISGACLIKRDKQRVVLKLRLRLKEGAPFIGAARNSRTGIIFPVLPQGFVNSLYAPVIGLGEGPAPSVFYANTGALLTTLNLVGLSINTGAWAAGDSLSGEFSWETNNPWPTTLPGTASGTIPFN